MRLTAILIAAVLWFLPGLALAQEAAAIVAENRAMIEKPSRQTIGPVIARLAASGDPMADDILTAWADRRLVVRKSDQAMFIAVAEGDDFALTALDGTPAGSAPKADMTELKPNAGGARSDRHGACPVHPFGPRPRRARRGTHLHCPRPQCREP